MNAQSSDEIDVQITEFLSAQLSIPRRKIAPEHSLFHDFGVDGDDAVELIQEYSTQFNVSVDAFELDKYFGPEVSSSLIQMIVDLFTKSNLSNTPRFTVKELIQGVSDGKL